MTVRTLVMIGPFPPPVHGMAVVNERMGACFHGAGIDVTEIDTAPATLSRAFLSRLRRVASIASALKDFYCIARSGRGCLVYLSVSGGPGKWYECLFALIGRLYRLPMWLHHHSYAYARRSHLSARALFAIAGPSAWHITQSRQMSLDVRETYREVKLTRQLSNISFVPSRARVPRSSVRAVGLLANLSKEKGLLDFLHVAEAVEKAGLPIRFLLAGPASDPAARAAINDALTSNPALTYFGGLHGPAKDRFFDEVDVFLFPTRYEHETEGIVNFEAMRTGAPVIAFGRGCIPEILEGSGGVAVPTGSDFTEKATELIKRWFHSPDLYASASEQVVLRFEKLQEEALKERELLVVQAQGHLEKN